MFKSLIKKRLNKLNDFSNETKIALSIEQHPIEILYGKQASAYAKKNEIKLGDGFFDYEGKEQPIILIKNPYGLLVKGVIRHELTHYKQFIEKRLIHVRFSEGKKYFENESELEAYKEGSKAFTKNDFIRRKLYTSLYHGSKLVYSYPKTSKTIIALLFLFCIYEIKSVIELFRAYQLHK